MARQQKNRVSCGVKALRTVGRFCLNLPAFAFGLYFVCGRCRSKLYENQGLVKHSETLCSTTLSLMNSVSLDKNATRSFRKGVFTEGFWMAMECVSVHVIVSAMLSI